MKSSLSASPDMVTASNQVFFSDAEYASAGFHLDPEVSGPKPFLINSSDSSNLKVCGVTNVIRGSLLVHRCNFLS